MFLLGVAQKTLLTNQPVVMREPAQSRVLNMFAACRRVYRAHLWSADTAEMSCACISLSKH